MFPTQVNVNEKDLAKLIDILKKAYIQITDEIKTATNFGAANRRTILKQIEQILTKSGEDVDAFIKKELPDYYKQGADQAVMQLEHIDAPIPVSTGFNRIHKDAIQALVSDTAKAFGESLTGVNRSANTLLGKAVRDQITQQMAVGKVGGAALKEIKNNIVGIMEQQGLSALKDKAGRSWELDRYAEMLIRTKAVEARNRGLLNRIAENDYDLVEVSSHGATDVCGRWEGKILSVTGQTPGYPTVAEAEADGLFHPNCKHAINALNPKLAGLTNAYDPDTQTYSPDQLKGKLPASAI